MADGLDLLRRVGRLEEVVSDLRRATAVTEEWRQMQMAEHRENRRLLYAIIAGVIGLFLERLWHIIPQVLK